MPDPVAISARRISYSYSLMRGRTVEALRDISFDIKVGEFVCIVGPSGAGKSTLLHILSRLVPPLSGELHFPFFPELPRVGYLFQSDSSFPWRTVEKNLTYALEICGEAPPVRRRRAEELCLMLGLAPGEYLHKFPKELSGGQRRRVELGIAMANEPNLLLLDEPTSAVDWITRRQLQAMIQEVIRKSGATAVAVTHDIEEAVWLSDRVFALRQGRIADSLTVGFPRPRNDEMRVTPEFKALQDQVVNALLGATQADYIAKGREVPCR